MRPVDVAFAPIADALAQRRIPGAALGLVTVDGLWEVRLAGHAALLPSEIPLTRDAFFDLASLTKVILTTPAVLRLLEQGRLDLDDPLADYLPDLQQYERSHPVRQITIRNCLAHRSGLPAVKPVYTWGNDVNTLRALVLQHDWSIDSCVYSDINFILLGFLVERLTGCPLSSALPPGDFALTPGPTRAVATEHCGWRNRILRGEVHDENAAALGGLAGHAGLFGTVDAVLAFAHALLTGKMFRPATLACLRQPHSRPGGPARALGWELPYPQWAGGSLASPSTLGHTGFTGTGVWIDVERGYAWTLLTNRVHPSRYTETYIGFLRRSVGNAIAAQWPFER